jgi:hypothetical protein
MMCLLGVAHSTTLLALRANHEADNQGDGDTQLHALEDFIHDITLPPSSIACAASHAVSPCNRLGLNGSFATQLRQFAP